MRKLSAAATSTLMCVAFGGTVASAQPTPPATLGPPRDAGLTRQEAVALVLAQDERFMGLPDYERQRVKMASQFSFDPVIGSSYYRVLPTATTLWPPATEDMRAFIFREPHNWLVEISLVRGCTEMVDIVPQPDPCNWRHAWYYRVHPDGTVTLLFEEGDPLPVPQTEPNLPGTELPDPFPTAEEVSDILGIEVEARGIQDGLSQIWEGADLDWQSMPAAHMQMYVSRQDGPDGPLAGVIIDVARFESVDDAVSKVDDVRSAEGPTGFETELRGDYVATASFESDDGFGGSYIFLREGPVAVVATVFASDTSEMEAASETIVGLVLSRLQGEA